MTFSNQGLIKRPQPGPFNCIPGPGSSSHSSCLHLCCTINVRNKRLTEVERYCLGTLRQALDSSYAEQNVPLLNAAVHWSGGTKKEKRSWGLLMRPDY